LGTSLIFDIRNQMVPRVLASALRRTSAADRGRARSTPKTRLATSPPHPNRRHATNIFGVESFMLGYLRLCQSMCAALATHGSPLGPAARW
jgi:hypothetical protein